MLPKIVFNFRHETGLRCVATFEAKGADVRFDCSIRSAAGLSPALAIAHAESWRQWAKSCVLSVGKPSIPALPSGWH